MLSVIRTLAAAATVGLIAVSWACPDLTDIHQVGE